MKPLLIFLLFFFARTGFAQNNIKIGDPAPQIYVTEWLANIPADTSLRGKYIVLEFWATWCKPCLKAVPHLNELRRSVPRKDLYFLSMTYEAPELALPVIERTGFETIVVTDEYSDTQISYGDGATGITNYPLTVLIDNQGIVRWIGKPNDLDSPTLRAFVNGLPISRLNKGAANNTSPMRPIATSEAPDVRTYDEWSNDPYITRAISLSPTLEISNFSFHKNLGGGSFRSTTVREIYRTLFPDKKLVIPEWLEEHRFRFTYIDKEVDNESADRLEAAIHEQLDLEATVATVPSVRYLLSIKDKSNLTVDTFTKFLSSVKTNELGQKEFGKHTVPQLVTVLKQYTNAKWQFLGRDKVKYHFVIDVSSTEAILTALRNYGFKIREKKDKIEEVTLSVPK